MPDNIVAIVEDLKRINRDLFEQLEQANSRRVTLVLTWFLLGFFSCAFGHMLVKMVMAYAAS